MSYFATHKSVTNLDTENWLSHWLLNVLTSSLRLRTQSVASTRFSKVAKFMSLQLPLESGSGTCRYPGPLLTSPPDVAVLRKAAMVSF